MNSETLSYLSEQRISHAEILMCSSVTRALIDKMAFLGTSDEAAASSPASAAKISVLLVSQPLTHHHLQHSILW